MDGEGEYNLNVLKEIKVTDSFHGLDKKIKGCEDGKQIEEHKSVENLPPCSGLIVTSYIKSESNQNNLASLNAIDAHAYQNYMKWVEFPPELQGFVFDFFIIIIMFVYCFSQLL